MILKYDLKTLREASHLSQTWLAKKLGVCVAKCRQMERAGDPRVLTAILESMLECDDERTITLREAYHYLIKH
jgi:predicted transcriptional regulator